MPATGARIAGFMIPIWQGVGLGKSALDSKLLQFATPSQRLVIESVINCGGVSAAAKSLGKAHSSVSEMVSRVRRQASARGYSPDHDNTHIVPETHYLKGVSTLYGSDDKIKLQWVKSNADQNQLAIVAQQAARAFFTPREPLRPAVAPLAADDDLMTCYVISDLHLGMYAWAREAGADYDVQIASGLLINAMNRLMMKAPDSGHAVIAQLGDLMHMDDQTNQTRRSHNALDVDTRYERVSEVALSLYRQTIDMALRKHRTVHVVNVPGNHDDISAMWLGVALKEAYRDEPRLTIDTGQRGYFYHRFGANLLGFTHGHEAKMTELGEIMSEETMNRPELAGAIYRHWLTGHIHHQQILELRTCLVESFRTLAAKDAYHATKGYRSGRDMRAITYHRDYGEDERYRVGVRELEAIAT
ncbi:metallophosphoesterase family protein [Roseiconus lacunae]|uniref:hypothetical protein n=1 Tax=Roseiconus lacunae TaxID=2605694 RepID=UPI001E3B3492|nr:hypothetical protein [Roseiconus lacunae]MCD0460056.1 hypothetical protein [Roseiconus lacunae]